MSPQSSFTASQSWAYMEFEHPILFASEPVPKDSQQLNYGLGWVWLNIAFLNIILRKTCTTIKPAKFFTWIIQCFIQIIERFILDIWLKIHSGT